MYLQLDSIRLTSLAVILYQYRVRANTMTIGRSSRANQKLPTHPITIVATIVPNVYPKQRITTSVKSTTWVYIHVRKNVYKLLTGAV